MMSPLPVLLGLLLAPAGPGAAAAAADPSAAYLRLVEYTGSGDLKTVVEALLEWPAARIEEESRRLAADPRTPVRCARLGVLAHTDTGFVAEILHCEDVAIAHFAAARRLLPLAASSDFDRDWRLAVGYKYQAMGALPQAFDAFQDALKHHPEDPEVFVAKGALYEHVAAVPPSPLTSFAGSRSSSWELAARLYQRALTRRPDYEEAHLRLGRVYSCLGRADDARRELSRVLAASRRRAALGYSHLFLGEMEERAHRTDEAVAEYKAALALDPRLQTAQLALAAVLGASGRSAQARAVLVDALRTTPEGRLHDWQAYHTSALHGYPDSLDRLWRQATQ
jgi:tetratricopeptide (TPR) repeat protein